MPIHINHIPLETFKFAGGECYVKIDIENISEVTEIFAHLNNSDDIMCLLLVVDAIRRVNSLTTINLTIPYFPYARQDRVCNEGESLSVKVMADIINNLSCDKVTVYDPHSDVTAALLNNCHVISQSEIISNSSISKTIIDKKLALVSPDAGAEKKIQKIAKCLSTNELSVEVFYSRKTRDIKTGNITSTEVYGNVKDKNLLIIDDICDGGKTFIELAKLLKAKGAKDIYLYITHGIFSKGLSELACHFKHVFCYHTIFTNLAIDSSILTILGEENDLSKQFNKK